MKIPTISVFMPVYNVEKYVCEAVDSVLGQTLSDFEFIIIDDGSTDSTLAILKSYKDRRIKLFKNKKNLGIDLTVNMAIEKCRGKYIARMDGDDVWLPEKLEKQVAFLELNKKISACGTWAKAIDGKNNFLFDMKSPTGLLLKYNYWKPSPLINSSLLMTRKSALTVYPYRVEFPVVGDYDFIIRYMKKYLFSNIPKYLMEYRIRSGSITKTKKETIHRDSWKVFVENYDFTDLKLDEFCSLSCLDYKLGFWERLSILNKLSKIIDYPCWFRLVDNFYYFYRREIYKFFPKMRVYG